MVLKKRLNKKVENYQSKLVSCKFSNHEVEKLTKLYSTIIKISNFFLVNIFLIAITVIVSISFYFIKKSNENLVAIDHLRKTTIYVASIVSGVLVLINRFLSMFLFFRTIFSSSKMIGWQIRLLVFLTIIPTLGVIFLFIAKFKIKYIYRSKKAKKQNN